MTFQNIKEQVMFQTANDADDLSDFLPALNDYVNEGYDMLAWEHVKKHVGTGDGCISAMAANGDTPSELPEWTHRAIADYATYLVYRNGNAVKQNRGIPFYQSFEAVRQKICADAIKGRQFTNFYP